MSFQPAILLDILLLSDVLGIHSSLANKHISTMESWNNWICSTCTTSWSLHWIGTIYSIPWYREITRKFLLDPTSLLGAVSFVVIMILGHISGKWKRIDTLITWYNWLIYKPIYPPSHEPRKDNILNFCCWDYILNI